MKNECPNCQSENNPEAKYCSVCGYALPAQEASKAETLPLEKKPKKKQNLGLIAVFVICFWGAFFGVRELMKPNVEEELMKVATDINKTCPIQVDEYTMLISVRTLPNKTIQYNYKLKGLYKEEIDLDTIKKYVYPDLLKNAKENPQTKSFRDNDITIKYNYIDQQGVFVTEYVITPKMYK